LERKGMGIAIAELMFNPLRVVSIGTKEKP